MMKIKSRILKLSVFHGGGGEFGIEVKFPATEINFPLGKYYLPLGNRNSRALGLIYNYRPIVKS